MKSVQTVVQTDNPDRMVEVGGLVSDSPLFTLASVSSNFLKASALETAFPSSLETTFPSTQGMGPGEKIPLY